MNAGLLECDRISVTLTLTASSERAERLGRQIHQSIERGLTEELARLVPSDDGEGYLFIDRLVVDGMLSTAWDIDAVIRNIAQRMAAALHRHRDDATSIAFRDRVEFVAAFMAALVDGVAWNRWWFEEFDGLKPLTLSSALRTLIIGEDEKGIAALVRLTDDACARVVQSLSVGDAARLLTWVRKRPSVRNDSIKRLWQVSRALGIAPETEPVPYLSALITVERQQMGSFDNQTLKGLNAMARLRHAVANHGVPLHLINREMPLASLLAVAVEYRIDTDWLEGRSEGSAEIMEIAAELFEAAFSSMSEETVKSANTSEKKVSSTILWTPFGGVFVLLALMERLGWFVPSPSLPLPPIPSASPPARQRSSCAPADHRTGGGLGWGQRGVSEFIQGADPEIGCSLVLLIAAKAIDHSSSRELLNDPALQLALGTTDPIKTVSAHRRTITRSLKSLTAASSSLPRQNGTSNRRVTKLIGGQLEAILDALAAELLHALTQRLPGLQDSTADYLRRNVLTLPARVECKHDQIEVSLGRAPLDVLLVLAGYKRGAIHLPSGLRIELRQELDA